MEIFNFELEHKIRVVKIKDEVWFVGFDVAKALGYKKPRNAISTHCKTKGVVKQGVPTKGGLQTMSIINEPNLYRLIVKSKLETAEKFEEWVFEDVIPTIRKKGSYGYNLDDHLPNFLKRYKANLHNIESHKYFSVITELFNTLYMELEKVGYQIPDKAMDGKSIMPDISVGKTFSSYLEKTDSEFKDAYEMYPHEFDDGRPTQDARKYKIEVLPIFRKFVVEVWIPNYAEKYFKSRDVAALEYLPKCIAA